jgi:hypothetical protein
MRSLSRDRSRLVLWPPAVRGRIIKSWFDHGRRMVSPGGRSGADQDVALSPLLAVTNVPVMLARLIAHSVVASRRSVAASRFPGEEPA